MLYYHLAWHYLKALTQTCLEDTLWHTWVSKLISLPSLLCYSEADLVGQPSSPTPTQHSCRVHAYFCSQLPSRTIFWSRPAEVRALMLKAKHVLKCQIRCLQIQILCHPKFLAPHFLSRTLPGCCTDPIWLKACTVLPNPFPLSSYLELRF